MTREPAANAPLESLKGSRRVWMLSALGTSVSAAALIVMAVLSIVSAVSGSASTTTRALTESAMLLVLGLGVGGLVVALLRHRSLAKTPTLLWNGMLVPIGLSLFDGGAKALGVGSVVVAVLTFAVTLLIPRYDVDEVDAAL